MPSIQNSAYPLVFPPASLPEGFRPQTPADLGGQHCLRTTARALEGMQKEAVVAGPRDTAWRMVCDEGPYLNGTDLAPFPLGFFCAGMVSDFSMRLLAILREQGIAFDKFSLCQQNRYSMAGSALAGTMRGSALPVELQLGIDSPRLASELQALLQTAVAASPAAALLQAAQAGHFNLSHNGSSLPLPGIEPIENVIALAPTGFDALQPAPHWQDSDPCIVKLRSAETVSGVAGGAGSSLSAEQKRILHMQGSCSLRSDGLLQVDVELFQPLGSSFRFLADPEGLRAPAPMAYFIAGIAFCYLTQIGRYTTIRKQPLQDYAIVQDTSFLVPFESEATASVAPVQTHVYLQSTYPDDYACQVVRMGEQTCFLHAACRQSVPIEMLELSRAIPFIP